MHDVSPPRRGGGGHRGDDLVDQIIMLGRRLSHRQYLLCRLLAEYDLSGDWATSGASSCSRWAAEVLEVESSTAREWLRVGHALRKLPEIDAAFSAGRLSYAKVRTLTRVAIDHPDRQAELIELGIGTTAAGLSWELARWTGREEDEHERDRRHRREMALTVRTEPDGSCVIGIRLPPMDAAAVMAGIDARMLHRRRRRQRPATQGGPDATADASASPSVTLDGPDHPRASLAQQRAAAFVEVMTGRGDPTAAGEGAARSAGDPPDIGARVQTEVIIHVRGDGNTLDDGTPVAGHLVERLVPDAFLRVLIHDAERRPINASGRRRRPTDRQKRVVAERDGHRCTHPGCDATAFLEYDHVPDFDISQHTVVEELFLRCALHHRERHRTQGEDGDDEPPVAA